MLGVSFRAFASVKEGGATTWPQVLSLFALCDITKGKRPDLADAHTLPEKQSKAAFVHHMLKDTGYYCGTLKP